MNLISARPLWMRRSFFVATHILASLVVYLVVIAPIRDFLDARDGDLAERRTTLARYVAVSEQEAAVQAYARQVAESNARGELIAGATAGIVDANLQAHLKSLAEGAKVSVRSIQMLPPKSLRGATLVGARLNVSGTIQPLNALTRALEGGAPLLLVTAAAIRSQTTFWGMAQPDALQSEPTLDAEFDIYGGAPVKDHP
jgi:general secretion pathway protein M